jgi:HEAT repeat protein
VSQFKSFILGAVVAAISITLPARCRAAEPLDNAKVMKMMREGVALEVILKMIESAANPTDRTQGPTHRFDDTAEALTELQKAGKDGSWKVEDIKMLQIKVLDLASRDKKFLKELVDRALNVFENADPAEYDLMMRTLSREGKRVVPYLLNNVDQFSERKRGGVVDALGRIGDKSETVTRAIALMLTDESKPVRLQTAKCIVALSGPTTVQDLIDRLKNRTEIHDGAAMALGYLGNKDAVEPLVNLLKNSGNSDERICAAFALGELRANTKEAVDALLMAVLDEHDAKLRETAANALTSKLHERRAPGYIIQAFHRYRQGREDLVANLAYLKDIRVLEFLVDQVDNDDPKLKKVVSQTLVYLTKEEGKDTEEWRGILEVLRTRPDWRPANDEPRIDIKRDKSSQGKSNDNGGIPTSLR